MDRLPEGEYRIERKGVPLWYRVSGRGPVCLAPSPAWGASSDYLFRSLAPLDALFTMVYLDTRGTGRSQRPAAPEAYTWEALTADLEALRRHLRQDPVWLLGHSYAGAQVMRYTLDYPAHVQGLILIDTHAADDADFGEDLTARRHARRHEPWYPEADSVWETEPRTDEELGRMLQALLPFYFVDQEKRERNAAAFAAMSASLPAWHAQGQRSPFSLVDRLAEIRVPTLVVVGTGDFICSPRQAQRVHEGIPHSQLLRIEAAGHFPWMEQPDAFYNGLRSFLTHRGDP